MDTKTVTVEIDVEVEIPEDTNKEYFDPLAQPLAKGQIDNEDILTKTTSVRGNEVPDILTEIGSNFSKTKVFVSIDEIMDASYVAYEENQE